MAESTPNIWLKFAAIAHIIFGVFLFALGILDYVFGDVTADVKVRGEMLLGVWSGILVGSKLEAPELQNTGHLETILINCSTGRSVI